jgi:hypothetical protein
VSRTRTIGCRASVGDRVGARAWLAGFILAAGSTAPAWAGVAFHNPLNAGNGFGWNSNGFPTAQQIADDVLLEVDALIGSITFYGFDQSGVMGNNFRIRLFATDPDTGTPMQRPFDNASIGFITGEDTGFDNGQGFAILEYAADIPNVHLPAGVPVWISILSTDIGAWTWSHSDAVEEPDDMYLRTQNYEPWLSMRERNVPDERLDQAFTLYSTVPAAPTTALFAAVAAGRRRRTR